MRSTVTLTQLRTRVRNFLQDTSAIAWTNDILDESIKLALEHLSIFSPNVEFTDIVPTVNLINLSPYGNILKILNKHYPHSVSSYPLDKTGGTFTFAGGDPYFYLNNEVDGVSTLRLEAVVPHTLDGLDGATLTTFTTRDETLLLLGVAGYACLSRSMALNETAISRTTSTPNYGTLSDLLLQRFENGFSIPTA